MAVFGRLVTLWNPFLLFLRVRVVWFEDLRFSMYWIRWMKGTARKGLGLLAWSLVVWPLSVDASVNIPLHHWTYEAIDRLVTMGLIDHAMIVTRPYSRKQAAQYVARALQQTSDHPESLDDQEEVVGPLLERLVGEFRPELTAVGAVAPALGAKSSWLRYGGHVQLEADAFSVGHGGVRLRENRGGEYYANGEQVQTDFRGWFELGEHLSLVAQPKYITDPHVLGQGATNNVHNAYMKELMAKFTLANVSLEVGRGTQWWGPGYHGTLLLSDQAFPMDMIKLGSEGPFQLPWVFRDLGQWKINSFLTQLDRDRDFPRAKVFGLRITYLPASWLELGVTRMTQFDGRGHPQSFPGAVIHAYTNPPNELGPNKVKEQAMFDFTARIPHVDYLIPFPAGLQTYGEIGSTDKWSQFPLPSRAAVLGGIYIPQLFRGDSTDLRLEYADTDLTRRKTGIPNVWYNDFFYQSGMRYRGFPLGHWVGTDGIDYFLRATRHMAEEWQLGVNLDYSERGKSNPVYEKKREAAVDLTWKWSQHYSITFAYTYQRIQNPGQITDLNPFVETFANGVVSNNNFFWTNFVFEF